MIITEIFRKDYTSIKTCHVAHDLYSCAITSNSRCTADGRCEPSVRERSLWMCHSVLPGESIFRIIHINGYCPLVARIARRVTFENSQLWDCPYCLPDETNNNILKKGAE